MALRQNDKNRGPKAASPTPLSDWVRSQTRNRRAAGVCLFTMLIACGGLAPAAFPLTPIQGNQQLLFVLLAGVLLGSRLGSASALIYLGFASLTGVVWPTGTGETPLIGATAGFLWSLPIAAYLAGLGAEKLRGETPAHFAIGAAGGIAAYHAMGTLRLIAALEVGSQEAFVKGAGIFLGQHITHGAIAVMIASSVSDLIRAREKK